MRIAENMIREKEARGNCTKCGRSGFIEVECPECDGTGIIKKECDHEQK